MAGGGVPGPVVYAVKLGGDSSVLPPSSVGAWVGSMTRETMTVMSSGRPPPQQVPLSLARMAKSSRPAASEGGVL